MTLGVELVARPDEAGLRDLVRSADALIPTPGLLEQHPVLALARRHDVATASEFDLAAAWDQRPVAAVTGTNGKTTVTELVVAALRCSGVAAVAAGNNELPLISAIQRDDVEVFVVEASSFRLAHTQRYAPRVGCWLNFAPDHLDVHRDLGSYEAAKARLWHAAAPGVVAVANGDDPVVMRNLGAGAAVQTFALEGRADWYRDGDVLAGPCGAFARVSQMGRSLPHDIANALAAAATAITAGATAAGVREALRAFVPGSHRLQTVGVIDGVRFYDDSKATTPHATVAALRAVGEAVLIAGGRNKGLDLGELLVAADHVRCVVAIGEAADELADVFAGVRPVLRAGCMRSAVELAAGAAAPAGAVLLSPACASFDAYPGYAARGEHFARVVAERAEASQP